MSVGAATVSVIVPTRARLEALGRCLTALADQALPRDAFEVVVVNDGGPPLDESLRASLRDRLTLLTVDQPWGGPASARNTGIARAGGEILAFTDDDCAPDPDWLPALVEAVRAAPEALVGGHVVNALPDDAFANASQFLVDYLYAWHRRGTSRAAPFFTSNNFAGRADHVRALGGFDTSFRLPAGEDRDFCDRWQASVGPLVYRADAVVRHYHAMSWRRFSRQHLNYGRGAWAYHGARAARRAAPRELEPLRFYAGLLGWPFRRLPAPRAAGYAALLAWSQVVNATGYALEAWRTRRTTAR